MIKFLLITTTRHFLILISIVSRTIMFLLPTSTKQCWFTRSPTNRHLLLLLQIWDREDIVLWSGFNLWGSEVWGWEVSMYFLFNTMILYVWSPALGSQKHGVPLLFCVLLNTWFVLKFIEADVPLYIKLCW